MFGAQKKQAIAPQQPVALNTLRVQTSVYGLVIPIPYGRTRLTGNLIWYGDFRAIAHVTGGGESGGGGKGGGGGGATTPEQTTYTYQAAVAIAICEGEIASIERVWQDKLITNTASLGMTVFKGTNPQTSWSHLATNHPSEALGYQGLAYVAAPSLGLTDNASLANYSFEVGGKFQLDPDAGIFDCDPAEVINDYLTNPLYSIDFAYLDDDLSNYSDYCVAAGLLLSPPTIDQSQVQEFLTDIAMLTNSEFVWSPPKLKIIPRGDRNETGNNREWTPNLVPLYDLDDDLLIAGDDEDPIVIERTDPADAFNALQLEFIDRQNEYNPAMAEAKLQDAIETFGLRQNPTPVKAHAIVDRDVARLSVQILLQRQYADRNRYTFRTGTTHCLLEPMDLVTLTDENVGLDRKLVRLLQGEEDEDGVTEWEAEELNVGAASSPVYEHQEPLGYKLDYNVEPGDTNPPVIFAAPVELAESGLEVWLGASGGINWGGCEVWISTDGDSYRRQGMIAGSSRQGVLSGPLLSGLDPDVIHTLSIDMLMSRTQVLSGTQEDADRFVTLCYVDGELLAYQSAQLTGLFTYDLTYLRRGLYGTKNKDHASGSDFVRIDRAIFKIPYTIEQIHKPIFIKLPAFNQYGAQLQDVALVEPFIFTIPGPPKPSDVQNFTAHQVGSAVAFKWDKVLDYALKDYVIKFTPVGAFDWDSATILADVAPGSEMTNADVPIGTWTFGIKARDIALQFSENAATVDLTVIKDTPEIFTVEQAPDWLGELDGFYRHWTGKLVPLSTVLASSDGWDTFDIFVDSPVAVATYTAPAIDAGFDDLVKIIPVVSAAPGYPFISGTPDISYEYDHWLTGETDPNTFDSLTVSDTLLRYARVRLVHTTGSVPGIISGLSIIGSAGVLKNDSGTTGVDAGGTDVVFSQQFHQPPDITFTPQGGDVVIATVFDLTTTGFTVRLWDLDENPVSGFGSWQATGN